MEIIAKIVALELALLACIATYVASERQVLLEQAFSKYQAWTCFGVGSASSCSLLTLAYDAPTAVTYWLSAVMVSWILLILATPHFSQKAYSLIWGTGLMLIAGLLG